MSIDLSKEKRELYELLLKIKTVEDLELFLNDLCTYKELDSMAQRLKAAKLLTENKTYAQIIEQTDISSATLSRVSRCLKYGEGYKKFLK
ncbi:MAG: TrpR-related protein YerC/YecD [Clostridia bacterium]|nr:TrpR-related protein YerC/YecD [Clostridia bacterium]